VLHLLSALGVDMADELPGPGKTSLEPDNPRGHWERWEIVEFHDPHIPPLNRDLSRSISRFCAAGSVVGGARRRQIRREIVAFLETRMGDGYFGFKDPRTDGLMPVGIRSSTSSSWRRSRAVSAQSRASRQIA